MAQNEMRAMRGLPVTVRLSEGLAVTRQGVGDLGARNGQVALRGECLNEGLDILLGKLLLKE